MTSSWWQAGGVLVPWKCMLTEAAFMTTAPQVLEGDAVMIIPGIACTDFDNSEAGSPLLNRMISWSPG